MKLKCINCFLYHIIMYQFTNTINTFLILKALPTLLQEILRQVLCRHGEDGLRPGIIDDDMSLM